MININSKGVNSKPMTKKKNSESNLFNTDIINSIMRYQPSFKEADNSLSSIADLVNTLDNTYKLAPKINLVSKAKVISLSDLKSVQKNTKLTIPLLKLNKKFLHHKATTSLPEFLKTKLIVSRNKETLAHMQTQTFFKSRLLTENNIISKREGIKTTNRVLKILKEDIKRFEKVSDSPSPSLKKIEYMQTDRSRGNIKVSLFNLV
jgi:hypothetical protein